MDIGTAGWLYKLPAGRSKGVSWHRRFFSLRGDSLLYFCHASEASGIRLAPRGVAQLTGAEVSLRPETATADGSLRFEFSLTHGNGDTLVLAAHLASERERILIHILRHHQVGSLKTIWKPSSSSCRSIRPCRIVPCRRRPGGGLKLH
uniref:PH domain-containing protein n=1 Tax=Haptolina ericina TaxID=156174 RepID=A0A7S3B3M4_9EUKA